ncbi:MAG TPA: hypothetical protein EYP98_17930, partial [Planctomycetes bacterium]|nr:hypothetical protein [Planctomycetota bacterium]
AQLGRSVVLADVDGNGRADLVAGAPGAGGWSCCFLWCCFRSLGLSVCRASVWSETASVTT